MSEERRYNGQKEMADAEYRPGRFMDMKDMPAPVLARSRRLPGQIANDIYHDIEMTKNKINQLLQESAELNKEVAVEQDNLMKLEQAMAALDGTNPAPRVRG